MAPEPVPANLFTGTASDLTATADPLDRVTLDDEVSTALLIVMESMTPAERVAFVLHDVFAVPFDEIATIVGRTVTAVRQLATSARRRVRDNEVSPRNRKQHDEVLLAFAAAVSGGDLAALTALLDPSVTLRSDGGGVVNAARRAVLGVSNVARFMLGTVRKRSSLEFREQLTGDGVALAAIEGDQLLAIVNVKVRDGLITDVWMQVNPEKLTTWSIS